MLFAALDSVQFNIPEVLIEPFPEQDEVVVVVNDKRKSFSTSEATSGSRPSSSSLARSRTLLVAIHFAPKPSDVGAEKTGGTTGNPALQPQP